MKTAIDLWFQSAVLRPTPKTTIQCHTMVCPQILDVPPSPVRNIRLVRQRYERLAAEMASVLTDAIASSSWNSAYRGGLLDAADWCLYSEPSWWDLKGHADDLRVDLLSRPGWIYPSEERDVKNCIFAIGNTSRALRALKSAEHYEYERQMQRRSR